MPRSRCAHRATHRTTHPTAGRTAGRTTPPTHRAGFTLVEVVVAVLLMAIAALGVASSTTYVARLGATAQAVARATRAAAQVVDSLRALPCTTLGSGAVATASGGVRWTTTSTPVTRAVRAVLTPASPRVPNAIVEEVLLPCE